MQTNQINDIENNELITEGLSMENTEELSIENDEVIRLREHNRVLLNEKKEAVKRVAELEELISEMKEDFQKKEERFNQEFYKDRLHKIFKGIFVTPPDLMELELNKYFVFKLEDDLSIGWYDKNGERFTYPNVPSPNPKEYKKRESLEAAQERYLNNGKPMPFTKELFMNWLTENEDKDLIRRFDYFLPATRASGGGAMSSTVSSVISSSGEEKKENSARFGLK